jgi:hypothetical protein
MATSRGSGFVNRAEEIETALQQVAALRHGEAGQQCLVNIHGAYGVGKTALLDHLAERVGGYPDLLVLRLDLPALAASDKVPSPEAKRGIVRQLLARGLGERADDAVNLELSGDDALERSAHLLLGQKRPIVLLINAESAGAPAAFAWVERGLLKPLVNTHRLVAVITSRKLVLWREPDTRKRAAASDLRPLSAEETAAQLGVGPEGAAAIFALTRGLPLANEIARRALAEAPNPLAWAAEQQTELMRAISEAIYARLGPEITPELRSILDVLAVVREFEVPLMQLLVNRYCGPEGLPYSQKLILEIIQQLTPFDLISWNQSYQVTPTLRPLLADALRRTEPERYRAIQATAYNHYHSPVRPPPGLRIKDFIELLWHRIDQQPGDGVQTRALFVELLGEVLLLAGRPYPSHARAELANRLRADRELGALLAAQQISVDALMDEFDAYVARAYPDL